MAEKEITTIDLCDYEFLIKIRTEHDILIDTLFNSARLDYDGKSLRFDGYSIGELLKVLCPNRYESLFNSLKEIEAHE